MTHDPVTSLLWRLRPLFVLILAVGIVVAIWSGAIVPPTASPDPQYLWLDWMSVVSGIGALLMLLVGQLVYDSSGWAAPRIADLVEACGWTMIEVRFTWMLSTVGDVPIHPLPEVALTALAVASMGRSLARWAEAASAGG